MIYFAFFALFFFNIWITLCCFLAVRSCCCCCRCSSCCCCCCRLRVVHRTSCLCVFRFILQCLLCFRFVLFACCVFLLLLFLFLFSVRRFLFVASFGQIFIFRWQRRPRPRIWTWGLLGVRTGVRGERTRRCSSMRHERRAREGIKKRERDKYRGRVSERGR